MSHAPTRAIPAPAPSNLNLALALLAALLAAPARVDARPSSIPRVPPRWLQPPPESRPPSPPPDTPPPRLSEELLDRYIPKYRLLLAPSVRRDLRLDPRESWIALLGVAAARRDLQASFESLAQLHDPEARLERLRRQRLEILERLEREFRESLHPDRARRLDEILLRQRGILALNDPELRREIRLDHDAAQALADALKRAFARDALDAARDRREIREGRIRPEEARGRALGREQRARIEMNRAAARILEPAQRAALRARLGAPFDTARLDAELARVYRPDPELLADVPPRDPALRGVALPPSNNQPPP